MLFRPSETAAYWTTEFQLEPDDIEVLRDFMVKRERPTTSVDLAQVLVEARLRREEQRIRRELARGRPYQPKDTYEIGETLVFPGLDFAVGSVVEKRPGMNPEHGSFQVVMVEFEETGKRRLFASGLSTPHVLNRSQGDDGLSRDGVQLDAVLEQYGNSIRAQLADQLEEWEEPAFANLSRYWVPADLLAEVHVGHLNIAEALIEVQSTPLSTATLLPELDLPKEIPPAIAAFSLDLQLSRDERFVDVGTENREWYLRRMLSAEAVSVPRRLQHSEDVYDRGQISVPLLQLEWELDDEWTEGGITSVSMAQLSSITVTLNYPHRRSGTLPLTPRTRGFFPVRPDKRSMFTFVDGRWGTRFPGWVMPDGRYVCGLSEWFTEHKLPVGVHIQLERTDNPLEVVVDFRPRRMRREWVRMARVEDGSLAFQLQKQAISCEYDPDMIVAEADPEETDELRRTLYRTKPSVYELLERMAPNLMGLSTQGTVHAKTLYSGINILRRTAPGPIFAALTTNPRFHETSDGLFALARP